MQSQHSESRDKLRANKPQVAKVEPEKCAEADPESKGRWIKQID